MLSLPAAVRSLPVKRMIGVLREIGRVLEVSGPVTACGVCCARWRCRSAAPLLVDSPGYGARRTALPRRWIEIIGGMATWPILPILAPMFEVGLRASAALDQMRIDARRNLAGHLSGRGGAARCPTRKQWPGE